MKKFSALIGFFFLAVASSFAEPLEEADSNNVEEVIPAIEVADLAFEFKNDKDTLTLVAFETGKVTITWSNIKTTDEYVGIRYQLLDGGEWAEVTTLVTDEELKIKDLEENNIFKYQLGTGTKDKINYGADYSYLNTISSSIFKNHTAKGKEEAADLLFAIEHNKLDQILEIYPSASYTVKYNTKIGKKQNKADKTKAPWVEKPDISINKVKVKLKDIIGGADYVYKVGLKLGDQKIWAEKGKIKTEL